MTNEFAELFSVGLKADGTRLEVDPTRPARLSLGNGDQLQLGDNTALFWFGGKWRRGTVDTYIKDARGRGYPVAGVTLLAVGSQPGLPHGLPGEMINVEAGSRAMREPLSSSKAALTLDEMPVAQLRVLLEKAIGAALQPLMASTTGAGAATKPTAKEKTSLTTHKGAATFKG